MMFMNKFFNKIMWITIIYGIIAPVYANCLILGDSIAVGVSTHVTKCNVSAKVGRTTRQIINTIPNNKYNFVLISAGTNDLNSASKTEIQSLRSHIKADNVMWVVPAKRFKAANIVKETADQFGDSTISIDNIISADNTHPTPKGYIIISNKFMEKF